MTHGQALRQYSVPWIACKDCGDSWQFRPENDSARRWLVGRVGARTPWFSGAISIEARQAADLVEAARKSGVTVETEL